MRFEFADGTKMESKSCAVSGGYLWLGLGTDMVFLQLAEFLSDASKTSSIRYLMDGEVRHTYEGYTELYFEQITGQDAYLAALKEEEK